MKTVIDYKPTVRELAELFCDLSSIDMAEFFGHCKAISSGPDWSAHGIYMQALYIYDEMKEGTPGADFLMEMAAPWYSNTLRYIDSHGERERA